MSKQKLSLQEQLLKSGLVSAAKAKSVKSEKFKQNRQQKNSKEMLVDDVKLLALTAKAEKIEKDRQLNELRQQKEEQKNKAAQIKQIVELNRLPQSGDGIAYRFNDNNKIKAIYVEEDMRNSIIRGNMLIVKAAGIYEVVMAEVGDKIALRDQACVVVDNRMQQSNSTVEQQNDPYAAYAVPDDLIW